MKKALLIVDHGSRSEDAVRVFNDMIELVRSKSSYEFVDGAHMQFLEPSIETAITRLAQNNIKDIILVPYFLYDGIHIKRDISQKIERLRTEHMGIDIRIAKAIGFEPLLADIIIRRAEEVEQG